MSSSTTLSEKFSKRTTQFFERVFIREKLNNWFGYLLIISLASIFGYLLAEKTNAGLIAFAVFLGIFFVIVCISSSTASLYTLVIFSFSAYSISGLLFAQKLPVGAIFDGLVLLSFIGILITRNDIKKTFKTFSKSPTVIFIYFNLLYTPIQFFNPNSMSMDTNLLALRKFVGYVLILFFAYTIFDSYDRVRKFLFFLFGVSALCGIYGCIQQWHGLFDFELLPILADPVAFGLSFINGDFRKFSTLSDASIFGILMAVCALFYLIIALHEEKPSNKVLLVAGCIFMILGMAYSGTRTAYATIIVGTAFYVLLNAEKKTTRVFGIIAAVFLVVLIYGPFYGNATLYRFRTTFMGNQDQSYKVRTEARNYIQPYIRSHPIGGGLGTTGFSGAKEHPGHPLGNFQPDGSYVKRAAEAGWIGLALICLFYFVTLWEGIRNYFSVRDEKIKIIYAACISGLFAFYVAEFAQQAIGGITDSMVYYPILAIILKLKSYDTGMENGLQT